MKKCFTLFALLSIFSMYSYGQEYINENFDTEIPSTWSTDSEADSYPWTQFDGYGFSSYTLDGTGFVMADADDAGSVNNLVENLESPGFDASAGNIVIVEFDTYYNDYIGLDTGYVQVWDGSEWHTAWQIGDELGGWLEATFSPDPVHVTVIITDFVNPSGDTKIRFRYDDGDTWAFYWAIDNVVVSSVDCLAPLQLAIDQLGAINTLVSWSSGSGSSNLAYGPAGFDIDDIAGTGGTLVSPATSPYTISGLDPETDYEFYVQDDCGADGMSPWSGPISFTTTVGCPTPIFFNFSNPSSTSIDVTFDQAFGNVHAIYGPQGFVPGESGDTTDVVTSPFTITGLDALTFYDVYLYMDCEGDGLGFSDNSGPWTFNTLVDGPGTSCADPIILNNNLPYDVIEQSICGYGDNLTTSPTPCGNWVSGYEEVVFAYAPETEDEVLGIFGSNFMTNSTVYFEVTTMCPDSTDAECVASGSWTTWSGDETFFLDGVELTNGETYYITITGWTGSGCVFDLSIFLIDCVTPTGLTATSFADGSAELSWTNGSDASNFQVEWGPVGFIPGEGTVVDGEYGVDGPPITIEGLTSETNWAFYVIDICGFGSESIAAGPFVFSGPPPPNNLCEDAIPIDCGDVVDGNTSAATTEGNPTEFCGTGLTANSVWYTFVGTGDDVTLDLCGSTYDTKIHLFSGDCDSLICVGGNDDNFNCNVSGLHSYLYAPTVAGETYYVIVSGFSSSSGVFTLEYNCITCGLIDGLTTSVTDVTANVNWNNGNIDGEYVLEYGPQGFTQGTGTTLTGTVGTDGPPVLIDGLDPGLSYDVYVYELCTPTDSNQTLSTSFITNLFPPPANDQPCNAIALECGGSDTATTLYATDIGNPTGGLCGNDFNIMEGNTVWWSFVGTGQEVNVSTCGSNFTTDLFIMSGSCDDLECVVQSAYNSAPCGDWNSTEVSIAAEEGVTYWVSVSPTGTWTAGGEVVLSIECIPCSTPTNIVASVTDVTANISWDSFNIGADFTLSWGPAGFDYPTDLGTVVTGNNATDLPVLLEGLLADELYDVYIYEYCESETANSDTVMTTFITNAFPPPANDDICNAIALEEGVLLETTNLYASTQLDEPVPPATGCQDPNQAGWCISSISNSTWYTFTPENGGMASISTCHPGSYDTQLAIYTGDCNDLSSLTLIGANDDQIGGCSDATFASSVNMCLEGGVTYYIQVDPYSSFGNGGDFVISADIDEAYIENLVTFDAGADVSVVWDYVNELGNESDFTLIYLNTTTGDTGSYNGNTAELPIILEGLANGQYEFYIYCTDDCNTSTGPDYFSVTVGIDELSFGNTVKAYPNPASDILYVEVNGELEKGTRISILSMDGKELYVEEISTVQTDYRGEIQLEQFARGVYLLKIEDSNTSIQEKIILQY